MKLPSTRGAQQQGVKRAAAGSPGVLHATGDGGFGVSGLLLASSSSAASGNQLGVGFYCCKDAFISMEIAIRSQIPAEDSIEVAGFLLQVPQELHHD